MHLVAAGGERVKGVGGAETSPTVVVGAGEQRDVAIVLIRLGLLAEAAVILILFSFLRLLLGKE